MHKKTLKSTLKYYLIHYIMFMELRVIYFLQMFADYFDAEILRSDKYKTKYCTKED